MNRFNENSKIFSNNLESVVDKILPETKAEEPINLPIPPTSNSIPASIPDSIPAQMQNNYEFKCVKVINQDPSLVTQPISLPTMQPNEILALQAAMNNASPNIAMDPNAPVNISSL